MQIYAKKEKTEKMSKKYLFSVVIPVYNVEKYLDEAIMSIVNQTIGFEKNIQLILVNDGSPDNSGDICKKYKTLYPENIVYVEKENGGVSAARNEAFQYIDAEYTTFLDADDKYDEKCFKYVLDFYKHHDIETVGARTAFFEASTGYHPLDYKFKKGTRIIDICDPAERDSFYNRCASAFIKTDCIGDVRFDTGLKFGEDGVFLTKIIGKYGRYGIVEDAVYYYRKRHDESSAVQTQYTNPSFYYDTIDKYYYELINFSKERYGSVIPYFQSLIYYDMGYRIIRRNLAYETLKPEDIKPYFEKLHDIMQYISDDVVFYSKSHKSIHKKAAAMELKYGENLFKELWLDKETCCLMYKNNSVFNLSKNKANVCQLAYTEIKDDKIHLDFLAAKWVMDSTKDEVKIKFKCGDDEIVPKMSEYKVQKTIDQDGKEEYYYYHCHLEYNLANMKKGGILKIKPYICFGDFECEICMGPGKFVIANIPLYKYFGKYALRCFRKVIKVYYFKDLEKAKNDNEQKYLEYLREKGRKDLIEIRKRLPRFKKKLASKGEIWLVSDRIDNAGDNAEVLFKYIVKNKPQNVRPIFVIGKNAQPNVIERIKSEGEMIFYEDKDFPYYFLSATKIISSSGGEYTVNPFDKDQMLMFDLYNFKYYFLNHGVNCGDCCKWLNKFNKNIHIFFNTGVNERAAIVNGNYNYSPEQCIITGLPRFDDLYENTKKQLLILPSWRKSIKGAYENDTTSSVYFDGFVDTDYFKFYNGLINDERLLAKMREKGYKGLFCLHPIFMKQYVDFEKNDVFDINHGFIDYNKVFAESAAMVTDYSTIAFDFAYLKKPIVYTQFDKEEFYETQTYDKGFFEYETDGFGPVCYDLDSAVNALIELIDNDCQNKYIDRVENFFVNIDKNNSKRVLDAILADDKNNEKPQTEKKKPSFFKRLFSR